MACTREGLCRRGFLLLPRPFFPGLPAHVSRSTLQQQQAIGRFYLGNLKFHVPRAPDVPSVPVPEGFQSYRKIDLWRIRAPIKQIQPAS